VVTAQVLLTKQLSVVDYQILDTKEKLWNLLIRLQRFRESRGIVEELDEKNKQTNESVATETIKPE